MIDNFLTNDGRTIHVGSWPDGYMAVEERDGAVRFLSCNECHAVVFVHDAARHTSWHDHNRPIVIR